MDQAKAIDSVTTKGLDSNNMKRKIAIFYIIVSKQFKTTVAFLFFALVNDVTVPQDVVMTQSYFSSISM